MTAEISKKPPFFKRFFHRNNETQKPVFSEAFFDKSKFPKDTLPFDLKVSDGGYKLERVGPPLKGEDGIRVFIVEKQELDRYYLEHAANGQEPEDLYLFLKDKGRDYNRLGKLLARGDEPIEINKQLMKDYYLIFKRVIPQEDITDPEKGNNRDRWSTPDILRFEFSPEEGFKQVDVDRVMEVSKPRFINLSGLTENALSLRITEPWYQTRYNKEEWRKFLRIGGYSKYDIKQIEERRNREHSFFQPGKNTLVLGSLREKQGTVPSPSIDLDIVKNGEEFLIRLTKKSGVNGVSVNGEILDIVADEKDMIVVPIYKTGQENPSQVELWFHSESPQARRRGLCLKIFKSGENVGMEYVSGVEEVEIPEYNPSAGIIKMSQSGVDYNQILKEHDEALKEKKRQEEEAKSLGTTLHFFSN